MNTLRVLLVDDEELARLRLRTLVADCIDPPAAVVGEAATAAAALHWLTHHCADVVLLECIPNELGAEITSALEVPVIGIGAGPATDGQILVLYDILDITSGRKPRFVKNFMEGAGNNLEAARAYVRAVKDGSYPGPEHGFS